MRDCRVVQGYTDRSQLGYHDHLEMSGQEETETKQPPKRYATTGIDKNRIQLEKLMKDPSKPVVLPAPPKEKTVRPPREMMKSVQGSSAGAGSGEFHVYKANRRREYERLKMMEEQKTKVSQPKQTDRLVTNTSLRFVGRAYC